MLALKAYWKSAWPHDISAFIVRWFAYVRLKAAAFVCSGLSVTTACSTPPPAAGPQAAAIAASRLSRRATAQRPALTLVEREGDPQRGLALAVYVQGPPSAALGAALLAEERLRAAGFEGARAHPSASGFVLRALGDSPESVAHFIRSGNAALAREPAAEELERVARRAAARPLRIVESHSEAALAACTGDLVLAATSASASESVPERFVSWRRELGARDVAFAVVGPREHLDSALDALDALPRWSISGGERSPDGIGDVVGSQRDEEGRQTLSVAVWGVPPTLAVAAAERFAEPESTLAIRARAGFPAWRVAHSGSALNAGAACLRVDLEAKGAVPSGAALAASARDVLDEISFTLGRVKPGPWVVAKQVLASDEADEAAAVAAWQALHAFNAALPSSQWRRVVHYEGELADEMPDAELAELVAQASDARDARIELRRAVEAGQGQFWMLLASPCATGDEDAVTAGSLALALHASALRYDGVSGVSLEPWLSTDAMGIVAHGAAATPHESPLAQAERVAEALARALLGAAPAVEHLAQSRQMLLESLGRGPTPLLSLALRQASADHPSWLDARGTYAGLSNLPFQSVKLRREAFLRGSLRIATLANHDQAQSEAAEQRLVRLLRGADASSGSCPPRRMPAIPGGQYRVEDARPSDPDALIAVQLPPDPHGLSEEARWTEWLMNRTDGWLHRALVRPGLVSAARAWSLGGSRAAALLIEIRVAEGQRDAAVAQVRGLLERLRAGAATAADVESARRHEAQKQAERLLDPRGRLVELWRGSSPSAATLASLHALHRAAFEPGREVVVLRQAAE